MRSASEIKAGKRVGFVGLGLFFLFSCGNGAAPEELSRITYRPRPYRVAEPARFVGMDIPAGNPLTEAGVALGRQLFFDPLLSADSTVSCATCHQPARAFTDGQSRSAGLGGRMGLRNAPSLINVAYQNNGLFWDGRVRTLEQLVIHPVQDTNEMGSDWPMVIRKLQQHPNYPAQFRKAFGILQAGEINRDMTARALSQYLRTLVSGGDSRYDRYRAGLVELTPSEERGRRIFFDIAGEGLPESECGHCHVEPFFSGQEYFNNGLEEIHELAAFPDGGRGKVTGHAGQMGAFRTPSLRNVSLTAPYMHDGRFKTLEEVIDHYNDGGRYSENVHPNVRKLGLSPQNKADLIAFLHTLSDPEAGRLENLEK